MKSCIFIAYLFFSFFSLGGCKHKATHPRADHAKEKALISESKTSKDSLSPSKSSLWQGNSYSFLSSNRSWKVGDIVKVKVKIQGTAQREGGQKSSSSRNFSNPITRILGSAASIGMGLIKPQNNPFSGIDVGSEASSGFKSSSSRDRKDSTRNSESINFEIAVIVKDVLPGGNLVINGVQEVNVNGESRKMYLSGIIRPRDINADNCIDSDKIAEANIAYGIDDGKVFQKKKSARF